MPHWIKRSPHDKLRAPRHLKDYQRSWFDELLWAMYERGGYLPITVDLWRLAGSHSRDFFERHKSAVTDRFERATMAREEVLFYPPLLELIHNPSTAIHRDSTVFIHRAGDSQGELFSDGYTAVADRGGGLSPSTSASGVDFYSKKLNPKNSSTREAARKSSGGYTQADFDARDLRKLNEARKEADRVHAMQPWLSEDDIFELQCDRAGLTISRGLEVKALQRKRPDKSADEAQSKGAAAGD